MKLKRFEIDGVAYFCNDIQIKEAGSLKAAAEKMKADRVPMKKMKPKKVDKVVKSGEKPTE